MQSSSGTFAVAGADGAPDEKVRTSRGNVLGATITSEPLAIGHASVGIVVLAYNNVADTVECLGSLRGLTYSNHHIFLVDNGSTDGTSDIVPSNFPEVTILRVSPNRGLPAGLNVGVRAAVASGNDYVFALNNDTTLAPDLLTELVEASSVDKQIGALMPKVLYYDDPDTVWSVGARYRRIPPAIVFVGRGAHTEKYRELRDVDYAPSCGLLIRSDTFLRCGLFDEGYRFYFDDWDFCKRVRRAGLRIVCVPKARLWHKVSRTILRRPDEYWRAWGASSVRYFRRHGRPAILAVPWHVGYIAARELLKGNGKSLPAFCAGGWSSLRQPLTAIPTIEPKAGGNG